MFRNNDFSASTIESLVVFVLFANSKHSYGSFQLVIECFLYDKTLTLLQLDSRKPARLVIYDVVWSPMPFKIAILLQGNNRFSGNFPYKDAEIGYYEIQTNYICVLPSSALRTLSSELWAALANRSVKMKWE